MPRMTILLFVSASLYSQISAVITGIFCVLLLSHSAAHAFTDEEKKLENELKVANYRDRLSLLQQAITTQEQKIIEGKQQQQTILSEISLLDEQLKDLERKLEDLEINSLKQQLLIEEKQGELERIARAKQKVLDHLQKRISAYYTMGEIGILNVAFSSQSLPDLLSFHESFDSLIKYDKAVISKYKTSQERHKRAMGALILEKSLLDEFTAQTLEAQKNISETRAYKNELIARIQTQARLRTQAIAELQSVSNKLVESIVSLKNDGFVLEKGFSKNKGSLPPPFEGVIVTQFNEEKTDRFGGKKIIAGLEFKVENGAKAFAIDAGKVIYSSYLKGLGNTVIINHGEQYHTVTARLEKLLVKKGDKVSAGQVIAITGDVATLFEDGVYFEIRHQKTQLDPLQWLNPKGLRFISR
ncbi:MAG: hypothetical protein CSA81_02350 [Acidobacteria bacterium]|nr:MAG: hypothetical protein CSA81_02350 [Acidobacteriota bacterium]